MTRPLVDDSYVDAFRERRMIAPDVRAAVLRAMGLVDGALPDGPPHVAIVRRGGPLPAAGIVRLEDGTELGRVERLPRDVPFGYHELLDDDGRSQLLITGPGRCHLPLRMRDWGWAVQLASVRSTASWGIGDLGDLRGLAEWSAGRGAGFLAVSPLGAPNPGPHPEPSPYYPSTRRFGSPLHVRVEEVRGAGSVDLGDLVARGHALNAERRIDRTRVLAAKREALERIWGAGAVDRAGFEAWRGDQGPALARWSVFCVLSERFGPGWQSWRPELRDPDGAAVAAVAGEESERVAFHAWVQWCFDRQLASASTALRRIADMPVGVDPGGFDAWDWQAQLAIGASVGAPPDRFNVAGQDWGLPPFIPHRLREAHYRPFIDTIRAQLRHAGGLRIDHVLGLFRLWWIPSGHGPERGAYVRYPTDELLEIVALESHRASAILIGEDLGTVSPGVRRELRRRNVLSTRLAYFEKVPPSRYPHYAFAAATTHDLPTIAGAFSGSDLHDQRAAGVRPDPAALALLRSRMMKAAGVGADATLDEVIDGVHRRLAAAPSVLVAGTLEDALRVEERPNLPGTGSAQRDNWSIALPMPLEEVVADPRVLAMTEALTRT
ncbi:MAG: 4-alpha-glucanotransferase [Candidatus Limnocylindria bacterium]